MNDKAITGQLFNVFKENLSDLSKVKSFDIVVSFIQLSGFKMIESIINDFVSNGIPVRIITSTYMNVTDPTALSELFSLKGNIEVKLYAGGAPSFHPKAYFINGRSIEETMIYIGSSNLSKVALTNGVEWNYIVDGVIDPESVKTYQKTFDNMFENECIQLTKEIIIDYRKTYVIPEERREKSQINVHYRKHQIKTIKVHESSPKYAVMIHKIEPNSSQTEALNELRQTREEGNDKALVVAATGVGKTYLAAFDSKEFESILFIAHREEILNQAFDSFSKVRGESDFGRLYAGYNDLDKQIVFASIQSLSRVTQLEKMDRRKFQYIIVDEIHHGTAPTYNRLLRHFEPEFLLGLTATPHRMDRKDVFAICDFNMVYEVDLFQSINRGWLAPYKYYGIYDSTVNYENITFISGKYAEKELERALSINARAELVYKHYLRYKRKRALAFCSSIEHAEYMADFFKHKGKKVAAIHSQSNRMNYVERNAGIKSLESGELEVIFSVDMLNDGVDIPSLDLLLFLRPTESSTIFLQQLGRGLRKSPGKAHVNVLDFIGNFKNADLIPLLLGNSISNRGAIIKDLQDGENLPLNCLVDFEFEVVDLLEKVLRSRIKAKEKIEMLYDDYADTLDKQGYPSRVGFFTWLTQAQYRYIKSQNQFNPFKDFCGFLIGKQPKLIEEGFKDSKEARFINMIEKTSMTKMYKMPVLLSFLKQGKVETVASQKDIVESFRLFYGNPRNRKDMDRDKSSKDYQGFNDDNWWRLTINNPIHFLCKTHSDTFELRDTEFLIKQEFDWTKENSDREKWFYNQVQDAIAFRRFEFLDQRLEK
ncbi:MAG: DEAD/DEAH box helicase family protein [Eubacteriales bacterium]|nr:DEAD/DEAH box helicase family protein [Eubacteriales bacterium]